MKYCYVLNDSCVCFENKQEFEHTCYEQFGGVSGGDFGKEAVEDTLDFLGSSGLLLTLSVTIGLGLLGKAFSND